MSIWRTLILLSLLCCGSFALNAQVYYLPEVEVKKPYVVQRGDTTSYIVDLIKRKTDRTVEDLLRMIPGIEIGSDGSIYYNGKSISHFYIEGMDLLGDNYTLVTRHVCPEDIQLIQVLDNHQPVRVLKNHVLSDRGAINLKLKKESMLKPLGHLSAGAGYCDNVTAKGQIHTLLVKPKMQQLGHLTYNHDSYSSVLEKSYTTPTRYLTTFLDNSLYKQDVFDVEDNTLKRYARQRKLVGCYNLLKKNDHGYIVKLDVAYSQERKSYGLDRENRYMTAPGEYLTKTESNRTIRRDGNLKVGLDLEKNEDNLYVKHHTDALWMRSDHDYFIRNVLSPSVSQWSKGDYINLQSSTTAIVRKGDKNYSGRIKAAYVRRPGSRLEISPYDNPDSTITQSYGGESCNINAYSGLSHSFDAHFHIGFNIDLTARYERFSSASSLRAVPMYDDNRYRSWGAQATCTPYAAYRGEKFNVRLEIPLSAHAMEVDDRITNKTQRVTTPDIGVKLSSYVHLSPMWKLDGAAGKERQLGDLRQFIMSPIYISYNTLAASGVGHLSDKEIYFGNLSLNYRNQLEGWSAQLSGDTKHISSNLTNSSTIGEQDETAIVSGQFNQKRHALTMRIAKSNFDQEWIIKGNVWLNWMENNMIRQSYSYRVNSLMENYHLNIQKSFFEQRLLLTIAGGYNKIGYRYDSDGSGAKNGKNDEALWSNDNKIEVSLPKGFSFSITSQNLWRSDREARHEMFYDGGVVWRNQNLEIELTMYNLTNRKIWRSRHADAGDHFAMTYYPRPIEFQMMIKYIL